MIHWPSSLSGPALAVAFVLAAGPACAQNLVSDPHFASGLGTWFLLPGGVPIPTLLRDPGPGADTAPGFATLTAGTFSPILYTALTCVPVQPGVVYSFGGTVRFRAAQHSSAIFSLTFFADGSCGTAVPAPSVSPATTPADARALGAWTSCAGTGATAPPGAASATLELILVGIGTNGTNETAAVDFDDVYVGRAGTVEPPVPVPFLSQAGVLALGIALALGGTLAIRAAR